MNHVEGAFASIMCANREVKRTFRCFSSLSGMRSKMSAPVSTSIVMTLIGPNRSIVKAPRSVTLGHIQGWTSWLVKKRCAPRHQAQDTTEDWAAHSVTLASPLSFSGSTVEDGALYGIGSASTGPTDSFAPFFFSSLSAELVNNAKKRTAVTNIQPAIRKCPRGCFEAPETESSCQGRRTTQSTIWCESCTEKYQYR